MSLLGVVFSSMFPVSRCQRRVLTVKRKQLVTLNCLWLVFNRHQYFFNCLSFRARMMAFFFPLGLFPPLLGFPAPPHRSRLLLPWLFRSTHLAPLPKNLATRRLCLLCRLGSSCLGNFAVDEPLFCVRRFFEFTRKSLLL